MPNASWRRWGVATARGGVSPTLGAQRKGREGCTSGARKPGDTPCGREGETPLSSFCCCRCFSANQGGALRGRNGPAEVGGGGRAFAAVDREESSSHQRSAFMGKNRTCELKRIRSEKIQHYRNTGNMAIYIEMYTPLMYTRKQRNIEINILTEAIHIPQKR